jgi:sporulation protein YtfJ
MDNQKNTQKNKLNELVDTALDNLRGLVDANTVIGTPIVTASGTTVIPVSKVSIGIAGGGNDYSQKGETASGKASFSGGGGTGLTMIPLGFLVVSPDGSVELLNIANPTGKKGSDAAAKPAPDLGSAIETVLDKAPDAISKIKDVFTKKKKDEPASEDAMEIVADEAGEQK